MEKAFKVLYRLHCFAKWRTQIYQAARARFYIRKSLYIIFKYHNYTSKSSLNE